MQSFIESNIKHHKLSNTFYKNLISYYQQYPKTTLDIIYNLHKIGPGSWKDTIRLLKYTKKNEILDNKIFDFLIINLQDQISNNKCDLIKNLPNFKTNINKNTSLVDRICKIIYPGDKKPTARGKYRKLKSLMKKKSGCFTVNIHDNNTDVIKYLSLNSILYNYYKNPEKDELVHELKKKLEKLDLSHLLSIYINNTNISNIVNDILIRNMDQYVENLKKINLYHPDREFLVDLSKESTDAELFIHIIELIFVNQKKQIYVNYKRPIKIDIDNDITSIIQKLKSNLMPSDKIYITPEIINKKLLIITPKKYELNGSSELDVIYCCLKNHNIEKDNIIYYDQSYFNDKIKDKMIIIRNIFSKKEVIFEQNYNKIKITMIIIIFMLCSFYLSLDNTEHILIQ
jgi:hypothetical protein